MTINLLDGRNLLGRPEWEFNELSDRTEEFLHSILLKGLIIITEYSIREKCTMSCRKSCVIVFFENKNKN